MTLGCNGATFVASGCGRARERIVTRGSDWTSPDYCPEIGRTRSDQETNRKLRQSSNSQGHKLVSHSLSAAASQPFGSGGGLANFMTTDVCNIDIQ